MLTSLTQIELIDRFFVFLRILLLEIIQNTAAPADEHEHATAGVVILFVGFKMFVELIDLFRQHSDLDRC